MSKPKHCLQHSDRPVHSRGRCKSCYVSIMRMINSGRLTDKQAVKLGYLLPGGKVNRNKKCINHRKEKRYARGLCRKCYCLVNKAIKDGLLDEAKAIRDKLILPSNRNG